MYKAFKTKAQGRGASPRTLGGRASRRGYPAGVTQQGSAVLCNAFGETALLRTVSQDAQPAVRITAPDDRRPWALLSDRFAVRCWMALVHFLSRQRPIAK